MHFCDTLTNEQIVARMRKALKGFECIDLANFRVSIYRRAGIPTEQIRDYDHLAYPLEVKRREVMEKRA